MNPDAVTSEIAGPAQPGRTQPDHLLPIRIRGPLTVATAPKLRTLIRDYADLGTIRLLLDLQAVTAIDVCGVAALLNGSRMLEATEGGVVVLRVNATVRRALKDSGTITAFRLSGDRVA